MALSDNIVAYYKLDESSGNASDSVGSITLTNTNTVSYVSGLINNCADGGTSNTNKCLKNTSSSPISYTQFSTAYSISMFVNIANITSDMVFFFMLGADGSNNRKQATIGFENATDRFYFNRFSASSGTATEYWATNPSTSTWYHLVATYDGTTAKFYVNAGTPVTNSFTYANGVAGIASCLSLLAQSYGGTDYSPASAKVDEVGIWSRALSASEVTELYNGGAGNQYPFSSGGSTFAPRLSLLGVGA